MTKEVKRYNKSFIGFMEHNNKGEWVKASDYDDKIRTILYRNSDMSLLKTRLNYHKEKSTKLAKELGTKDSQHQNLEDQFTKLQLQSTFALFVINLFIYGRVLLGGLL